MKTLLLCAGLLAAGSDAVALQTPRDLLEQAITAAGGRQALEANPSLEWRGTATIFIPNRTIEIAGHWQILPPDSAVVATYPVDQGPSAMRRLILGPSGGWTQRGETPPAAMPPGLLTEERHQFYLYHLLRLVPLLDPAFTLEAARPDGQGNPGIRVTHRDHPEVTLYFGPDHRVASLRTVFAAADSSAQDSQLIHLRGSLESGGMRWFREMDIERGGKAFFHLRLAEFRAATVQDAKR